MDKLNWSYSMATTKTHNYVIKTIGNTSRVIYAKKGGAAMKSSEFDSVEAAKQWAQNYNDKWGE